jgi:hypothetical protein
MDDRPRTPFLSNQRLNAHLRMTPSNENIAVVHRRYESNDSPQILNANAEEVFNHCLGSGLVICRNDRPSGRSTPTQSSRSAIQSCGSNCPRLCNMSAPTAGFSTRSQDHVSVPADLEKKTRTWASRGSSGILHCAFAAPSRATHPALSPLPHQLFATRRVRQPSRPSIWKLLSSVKNEARLASIKITPRICC